MTQDRLSEYNVAQQGEGAEPEVEGPSRSPTQAPRDTAEPSLRPVFQTKLQFRLLSLVSKRNTLATEKKKL